MMLEFPIDFQRKDKNAVDFTVTIGYTFYRKFAKINNSMEVHHSSSL